LTHEGEVVRVRRWGAPQTPDNPVSQLLQEIGCIELHPDEGGGSEEKPHQGVQTAVLSAGGHRREASCSDLCREHNLSESVLLRWRREYESRAESAFTEKQLSQTEALERKVAELERFCGKLALENEILKKEL
jgi:hypothetical protein